MSFRMVAVVLMASAVPSIALADDARLASVILSAEDRAGVDLVDVTVFIDGKEGPHKLDGRATVVEPGAHTFVFQLPDGQKVERRVVLRAGEKAKCVPVTFGAPVAPAAPAAASASEKPASTQLDDAALRALQPRSSGAASPLRLVGFSAVGVGIAGLAVGTIFGLVASSTMSGPQCDAAAKVCDPGVMGEAKSAATVSTIGFVAGGALIAGGLSLVLLAPKRESNSASLTAAPAVGMNGGGLSLAGAW